MRRQRVVFRWAHAASAVASAVAALLAPPAVRAGAVTDGSAGAVQTLSGNFTVPQSLGTVRGTNLFHSFSRFGVATGESATFTTADPGLRNVISRVTGGEASVIQGLLRLDAAAGSAPAFYFINPSGITIGAGGVVDVPGALHLSTAPLLNFGDGFVLDARSATASTFTVAAPESFGFVGGAPVAALRWQDVNTQLALGATLSLTGGDVSLSQAQIIVPGGQIRVQAAGALRLEPGAILAATAPNPTDAGRIEIDAASLRIDGVAGQRSGLLAQTEAGANGSGINVRVAGAVELTRGAEITAESLGSGGGISIAAARLLVDGGGGQATITGANFGAADGPAVAVNVTGAMELLAGGFAGAFGLGTGAAGDLSVRAGSIRLEGVGSGGNSGLGTFGRPGNLTVDTPGLLSLRQGASLVSSNQGPNTPGSMTVQAGSVLLDGADAVSEIRSEALGSGPSAALTVQAVERVSMSGNASISNRTVGAGAGGTLRIVSPSVEITNTRSDILPGLSSAAESGSSGRAGDIEVVATRIDLNGFVAIGSNARGSGPAGNITLTTADLVLDGRAVNAAGATVFSQSSAAGPAGAVRVLATGQVTLRDGASIYASGTGTALPGSVDIVARSVLVDGRNARESFTAIGTIATRSRSSAPVSVTAGRIDVVDGLIASATATSADAGPVRIRADVLNIDGSQSSNAFVGSDSIGPGNAGRVEVDVGQLQITNLGRISSNTFGSGRGGAVSISAQSIELDHGGGIGTATGGSGAAGSIDIHVTGQLAVRSGGVILASTRGAGAGGQIGIRAGSVLVEGSDPITGRSRIASAALTGSGGQAGGISLTVDGTLALGRQGLLSTATAPTLADPASIAPATLAVQAGDIRLDGAEITASAGGNVRAGSIRLATGGRLRAFDSRISTTSVDGDGGPVSIDAAGGVLLKDSAVSTSVSGRANGNGGDITIGGSWLALASGFIQANTAAPLARGGQVTVDVGLLVPDGSNVFVGGNRIASFKTGLAGFNVVQAAAPDGVAGQLDVTIPELNLAGSLAGLATPQIDFGPLARDWCEPGDAPLGANPRTADAPRLGEAGRRQSTLTVLGRGAVRAPASGPLGIMP